LKGELAAFDDEALVGEGRFAFLIKDVGFLLREAPGFISPGYSAAT
jgi:hypothetical protein